MSNINNNSNLPDSTENIDDMIQNNNDNLDIEEEGTLTPQSNNFLLMSKSSQQYFKLFQTKPNHVPAQFIVHAAFAQHSALSSQFCNMFETEFHLQATMLCLSTSNLQHQQIVTMFHMLESCINLPSGNTKFESTRLPTTMTDIHKYYISKSTSIRKSLPHPTPIEFEEHVVLNLKDVMTHIFAYGTKLNGICPYDNHDYMDTYVETDHKETIYTPFIQDFIDMILKKYPPEGNVKPLLLLGTVWSDGFDANNVVHSAPSIWMRTMTIAPPQDMTTSIKHTFILHMSKEGVCHEKIDKMFDQELQDLENGMWYYSTTLKKSIFVIFKVHVYAADRPERGKLTHVLGHTGVTTKRWMYSAYLPSSKMQSCDVCF